MKWRVGEVAVTKIVELEVTGGSRFILPQATYDAVLPIGWLQPDFADERGRLKMSIHALLVETPSRRIVVDTCLGNDKETGEFRPGTSCGRVSYRTLPLPAIPARRSTPWSAPISTSITSAGTRCWSMAVGSRLFLRPGT
jgi:hypothetical protein